MSFASYSITPALNVTIGGVNTAEGCPPGGMNNAVRQLAADGRELYNTVAGIPPSLALSGGTVTGNITRSTKGVHLYFTSPSMLGGGVTVQAIGGPDPTAENPIVLEY